MGNRFLIYRKPKLSKWLLTATVLLSTFVLLPSINNSKPKQQKTQTEILCSFTKNFLTKTAVYKDAIASVNKNKEINTFHKDQTNELFNYHRHIIVRLLSVSRELSKFEKPADFIHLKAISKSLYEDDFISIKG